MGKIVSLEEFKQNQKIEEDYLKFLSHVNSFVKVPTTIPELIRAFYFTLRYLEGNINCFSVLTMIKQMPQEEVEELRTMVLDYLEQLSQDLQKY